MTIAEITQRKTAPSAALAVRPGQEMWDSKQQAALATLGIKDASKADLAVFMHYCQKTGLDPFSRQIYMIGRRERQNGQYVTKQTIQVGIDGFRVIRDRVAARLGVTVEYEDTIWYDADGTPHTVWLWDTPPAACNVTVVKDGKRFPGVVRTAAYAATKDGELIAQWRTQADHMIEKVAEAFALRRAFPNDLGGIYLDDEPQPDTTPAAAAPAAARPARVTAAEIIGRATPPDASPADTPPRNPPAAEPAGEAPKPPRAATGQIGIIRSEFARLGYSDDDRDARLRITARLAGLPTLGSTKELDQDQATEVRRLLQRCGDAAQLQALIEDGEVPDA